MACRSPLPSVILDNRVSESEHSDSAPVPHHLKGNTRVNMTTDQLVLVLTVVDYSNGGQTFNVRVETTGPHFDNPDPCQFCQGKDLVPTFNPLINAWTEDPFDIEAFTLLVNGEIYLEEM